MAFPLMLLLAVLALASFRGEGACGIGSIAEPAPGIRKWAWRSPALIAFFVTLVRLPAFLLPMNRDSGTFAYGGWRILHGELPYLHFWDNKLPGVFYIDALAMTLFGPSPEALVLFQILYGIATSLLFFGIARKLTTPAAALIVTLLFAFYHGGYGLNEEGNYTESYLGLPVLLAVTAILHWSNERRGYLLPVLAGVLGACAGLIKQPAAAVVPALVLYVLFTGQRPSGYRAAVAVAAGALAAFGLAIVLMAHAGILSGAIDANLTFNRLYLVDAYTDGLDLAKWNVLGGLAMTALPITGAVACLLTRRWRDSVPGICWLLVPWFLLDLLGLAAGGRFYGHYFISILPSAFLLAALYAKRISGSRGISAAAAVGLFLFFGPVWSYESSSPDKTGLQIASIARQQVFSLRWIFTRRIKQGVRIEAERISDWIADHTSPSDTIYAWGYDPRIGFLAQRAFPSKYIHLHPLGASGFDRDTRIRELARDIENRRPKFIIDQSPLLPTTAPPLDSSTAPASTSPFFRLDGYDPVKKVVARYYEPAEYVGGCTIYGLR